MNQPTPPAIMGLMYRPDNESSCIFARNVWWKYDGRGWLSYVSVRGVVRNGRAFLRIKYGQLRGVRLAVMDCNLHGFGKFRWWRFVGFSLCCFVNGTEVSKFYSRWHTIFAFLLIGLNGDDVPKISVKFVIICDRNRGSPSLSVYCKGLIK